MEFNFSQRGAFFLIILTLAVLINCYKAYCDHPSDLQYDVLLVELLNS